MAKYDEASISILMKETVAWVTDLKLYVSTIHSYIHEIGDMGFRMLNELLSAKKIMVDIDKFFENHKIDFKDLKSIMEISDSIENVVNMIDSVIIIISNPNIHASVSLGMSRTYSESLKSIWSKILDIGVSANNKYKQIIKLIKSIASYDAIEDISSLIDIYGQSKRGEISTELYVNILLSKQSVEALAALKYSKDNTLDAVDTKELILSDSEVLMEYHPIQTMSYSQFTTVVEHEHIPSMQLNMPNAKYNVKYDLAPLINRKKILSYGSIANILTGVNYKLIERLNTIQVEPIIENSVKHKLPPRKTEFSIEHPLIINTNMNKILSKVVLNSAFEPPSHVCRHIWAPFAGSHPRVEKYADISASIILEAIRTEHIAGWNLKLVSNYETAILNKTITANICSDNALILALISSFEKVYEHASIMNVDDFYKIIISDNFNPADYICQAISHVVFSELDEKLHNLHINPAIVFIPHDNIVREARITQMIHVVDNGLILWKCIKNAYYIENDVFSMSDITKKIVLMKAFRKIITIAVREANIECVPLSLKSFASMTSRSSIL